ncbi:glycosyltransferase family 25 protein [Phragmitibacter flavus]|nr:glycosyltransferase family 25 protein [Phragmitibacter flavus]
MLAYVINMDSATDRWMAVQKAFEGTHLKLHRVSGVDGYALKLPIPEYDEALYNRRHGRPTSPGHVGCYLSHVRAMKAFLATDEPYALIVEDDLTLLPDFESTIEAALECASHWNILRLTGLSQGTPAKVASLGRGYSLCIGLGRLKGTGAYLIDRKGAEALSTGMIPMFLPIDHAIDREWVHGIKAAYVLPFPASQVDSGFRSSIQIGRSLKLSNARRWMTTYPYQAYNEISRLLFRSWHYLRAKSALASHRPKPTGKKELTEACV